MQFTSIAFAGFFALVFAVHWTARSLRVRNAVLLLSSYVFYSLFSWRCACLLLGMSLVGYVVGRIVRDERLLLCRRKVVFAVGSVIVFGALLFCKYWNFFAGSIGGIAGLEDALILNLILPLGLSFYTFRIYSYMYDSFSGRFTADVGVVPVLLYFAYFPQLISGPIDRAGNLIPQFLADREFDQERAFRGLVQFSWGLTKKLVVADTVCMYVNKVFAGPEMYGAIPCVAATVLYSIQIYCDFSGYSDMACGASLMLGIEPMNNFDRPYRSRSVGEFWRRWHISLSSWFKDYLYIPLGGSRVSAAKTIRNLWIVFLLSGLWHGAAWTFVFWGGLHALYLTVEYAEKKCFGRTYGGVVLTCIAVGFAWIFFRAADFGVAFRYCETMVGMSSSGLGNLLSPVKKLDVLFIGAALTTFGAGAFLPKNYDIKPLAGKLTFFVVVILVVVFMASPTGGEFIYSQF